MLWRIYFYRSGQVLAEALATAGDRARAGRAVGAAHVLMVIGIMAVAIADGIVQVHPTDQVQPAWLAMILGGPAIFLYGRIRLERLVFNRFSMRRLLSIAALMVLAVPLAFTTPLIAATAAAGVLLGMAVADARHAAGRPPEAPSPPF
ncbi:hypothetical protein C1I99_05700 [Micromonospora deserti]|uniref:Low temperature requirement protein A n=1 Tax=Micromonospora deserti TaxID=2070366 RepID=A0A2W2DPQ2_9ACTN|nr:hypothetical protein C1I99_05700 [Micromonospora deserti]